MPKILMNISLGILASFLCLSAGYAQEPCPASSPEKAAVNPNEKCKPSLGPTAPVVFEFPEDNAKRPDAQAKKDGAQDTPKPGSIHPAAEPGHPAAEPGHPDKRAAQDKPVLNSEKSDRDNIKNPKTGHDANRVIPTTCTYESYAWDTVKQRTTNRYKVSKSYAEVTPDERDSNAPECTVCREDQEEIDVRALGISHEPIRVCHVFAPQIREALSTIAKSGEFDVEKLEGYRPGKTRGAVDKAGLRTQWSQHSYGTALDINAHRNAIYSHCPGKLSGHAAEVSACRRGIGGDWRPEKKPRVSIVKNGIVYREMTAFWKWGGEIEGSTKDIMHFSITGY